MPTDTQGRKIASGLELLPSQRAKYLRRIFYKYIKIYFKKHNPGENHLSFLVFP